MSALALFSPKQTGLSYDYSAASVIGTSSTPTWCGPLTDEIQIITIKKCNETEIITLMIVGYDYKLREMNFYCTDSDNSFKYNFQLANGNKQVYITKQINFIDNSIVYMIGYLASVDTSAKKPQNWYQPYVIKAINHTTMQVKITTKQEGGYLNSHYNYPITTQTQLVEIKSLWINQLLNYSFYLSFNNNTSNIIINNNNINIILIKKILNNIAPKLVSSVTNITRITTNWIEYKITFVAKSKNYIFSDLLIHYIYNNNYYNNNTNNNNNNNNSIPNINENANAIAVTTLQTSFNYPIFHNINNNNNNEFICYKRNFNYTLFSYYTGYLSPGIISIVSNVPYTITYAPIADAKRSDLSLIKMINLAGTIVEANATTIAYAVLELGGNFNQYLVSVLLDGKSQNAWPITVYSYFIIRNKQHLGNCNQRKIVSEFLYNYYYNTLFETIAIRYNFAYLPSFIRQIVINTMLNNILCNDGSYALAKYRNNPIKLLTTNVIKYAMTIYLSIYSEVSIISSFQLISNDLSINIWNQYIYNYDIYAGIMTIFTTKQEKFNEYSKLNNIIITMPFAHFSIVSLYKLTSFTTYSTQNLRVTNDILIGIYTGKIIYWNDTLIQLANSDNKQYLPFQRIKIVIESNHSDSNRLISHYLAIKSLNFAKLYNMTSINNYDNNYNNYYYNNSMNGLSYIPFNKILDVNYLIEKDNMISIDDAIMYNDNTIAFYSMQYDIPNSIGADFCHTNDCSIDSIVKPYSDNGESLNNCQNDPITLYHPIDTIYTYDLMLSTNYSCYPIAGTIDFTTYSTNNPNTCNVMNNNETTPISITNERIEFAAWLFNGSNVAGPIQAYQSTTATSLIRANAYTEICNIECFNKELGYKYCNYRDCSIYSNDYIQTIETCNPNTQTRKVIYTLISNDCLENNVLLLPAMNEYIVCTYVPSNSSTGAIAYALSAIGMFYCLILLLFIIFHRKTKVVKRSQPIFLYIFMIGTLLMNLIIIIYINSNNNITCLMRPWLFNISSTIMFAPLLLKLYRVDRLFNNPKLKKIKITDYKVLLQFISLLLIDIILLILWTLLEKPKNIYTITIKYNLLFSVKDEICSTGLTNIFEIIFIIYKTILIAFGVKLAISTWNAPEDLSEAKFFAVAIYNIAMIGGLAYFISYLISNSSNPQTVVS